VDVKSKYLLNGFILKSFEFMMNAGLVELKLIGQREGNNFRINMSSVSGTSEFTYPIEEEPVVSPILFKWLVEQNPNVGETYEVLLLDPVSIIFGVEPQKLKATLRVEGQEQVKIPLGNFMTYRIKMNYMDSESITWITHDGEIVKEVSPLGLVSYKENENGLGNQDLTGFDIIKKTAISSNAKLKNPRDLILMRIKIEGISKMKGLNVIDNNRQFIRDGIIEIKVSDLSSINPYEIPYKGDEYSSYTEQSNLIQSRNLAIQNQATDIIDNETNSVEAARKINDWVYNYLEKTPTVSIPNALDVLKTRKGDCNEHATLFAALLNSIRYLGFSNPLGEITSRLRMKLPAASCRVSSNLEKVLAGIAVSVTYFEDKI
ncbi:transglutaminase-like domain-containing protein, partial [Desulfobacterota bacterium AH_259_B03_O07]|nr:transglutaminase-like domain-containing protein [Desulfobacterota bacterium AH_259_B03_O07]